MRKLLVALAWVFMALVSHRALACGGGYGDQLTIKPSQTIGVVYRGGQESYIFQPHFCGVASEFGLLLPVPASLTQNPTLTDSNLFAEFEVIAAPTVETVDVCAQNSFLGASSKASAAAPGRSQSMNDGVNVISSGTVGQFQWELLKADSTQSFTDWLDANHFAYPAGAATAFGHYVQAGWYFVAFRVFTGENAPPSGYRLCGDFGPISLSFQTSRATIPAHIATANDPYNYFYWRVLALSDHEQTVSGTTASSYSSTRVTYSGVLSAAELQSAPAVASIASAGQWFTALDVQFGGSFADDLVLSQASSDQAFRDHLYHYNEVNCGVFGCAIDPYAHDIPLGFTLVMLLGLFAATRRRR